MNTKEADSLVSKKNIEYLQDDEHFQLSNQAKQTHTHTFEEQMKKDKL